MRAKAALAVPLSILAAAGCPWGSCAGDDAPGANEHPMEGGDTSFTLFATTELQGQLEPCGCSTEPHGDIARTAQLVERARGLGEVVYVDGGSTTYSSDSIPEERRAQEERQARFIAALLGDELGAAAVGLGPYDLAAGPEEVAPARAAANVEADGLELAPPQVVSAGEARVGVFGVVSEAALGDSEAADLEIGDPAAAAEEAIAELERAGADVIVALAHMTAPDAEAVARAADGIDFVLVGQNAPEPDGVEPAPRRAGDAWLFQPANRGQVVTRLDVKVEAGGGHFEDALGPYRAESERARLAGQIESLREDLAAWEDDPDADPDFVAARADEVERLEARLAALEDDPLRPPDEGSWFTVSQIPVTAELDCHDDVQDEKLALDEAIGRANLELWENREPPEAPEGEAAYVGIEACRSCHIDEAEFWEDTAHAAAWQTLEDYSKHYDLDCVSCHVTGYDRPGGSNVAHNEGLRDVQCEVCHGPGSLHVEAQGQEETPTVDRVPPESLCVSCHNEEHSDTFQYEAYLRDITGPGHGEAFRDELGDGPTGRELRSAALAEADDGKGEGCL